ncbi:hypothetical protein BGZ83_011449 [Gryganskiella cystojenkinii]|nr:hypothetical protein BGZ83_011449 [Gryganskiella cystojenkinii]
MLSTRVASLFAIAVVLMLGTTAEAEGKKRCIQCFAPPTCPPCDKGWHCQIIPASCDDCGSGFCERNI